MALGVGATEAVGLFQEIALSLRRAHTVYIEGAQIPHAGWSRATVEEFAVKVAQRVDLSRGAALGPVVERLGGRLLCVDMSELLDDESGSIYVHGPRDFDIVVPSFTSPRRDRFTIAHELGHYFLHAAQGSRPIIAYRRGTDRCEWEANWFAASLLMPPREFRDAWGEHKDREVLASLFGVSSEAAEIRLKTLNCG